MRLDQNAFDGRTDGKGMHFENLNINLAMVETHRIWETYSIVGRHMLKRDIRMPALACANTS